MALLTLVLSFFIMESYNTCREGILLICKQIATFCYCCIECVFVGCSVNAFLSLYDTNIAFVKAFLYCMQGIWYTFSGQNLYSTHEVQILNEIWRDTKWWNNEVKENIPSGKIQGFTCSLCIFFLLKKWNVIPWWITNYFILRPLLNSCNILVKYHTQNYFAEDIKPMIFKPC